MPHQNGRLVQFPDFFLKVMNIIEKAGGSQLRVREIIVSYIMIS
jgi:hypothetical protein